MEDAAVEGKRVAGAPMEVAAVEMGRRAGAGAGAGRKDYWYELPLPKNPDWVRPTFYTTVVVLASVMTGFVSGFPAPKETELSNSFNWSILKMQFSIFASLAMGASILSAPMGVYLTHFVGKKITISIGMLLCLAGWIWVALSKTSTLLLWGRFWTGLGVGFFSYPVPLYMYDVSARYGTGLVALNQVGITAGWLFAYLIGSTPMSWRFVALIGGLVPSLAFFVLVPYIPEPERRAEGNRAAENEEEIPLWVHLLIGIGLLTLQQLCGMNAILFYSTKIFEQIGIKSAEINKRLTILLAVVQFLTTILAVALFRSRWEKGFLLISSCGMTGSLLTVAVVSLLKNNSVALTWISVSAIIIFVGASSVGISFIPWLIAIRRFPDDWLNVGASLALCVRSTVSCLVTLFAERLFTLSRPGFFFIFAAFCGVTLAFVITLIRAPA